MKTLTLKLGKVCPKRTVAGDFRKDHLFQVELGLTLPPISTARASFVKFSRQPEQTKKKWSSMLHNETHFQLGSDSWEPVTYASSEFSRRPGRQPPPFDPGAGNGIPDMNPVFTRDKPLETSVYKASYIGCAEKEDRSSEAIFRANWNKYQRKTHFKFGDDCVLFTTLPVKTTVATVDQMSGPLHLPRLTAAGLPQSSIFRTQDRVKTDQPTTTYKHHYNQHNREKL